ncbi:MAG TPA: ATP-binding protein [Candidatus Saccharimonadales bacterium]|jgi:signal transduction histidine kinase
MFRSALFKLTAVYVALVMSICIVFSVVLYRVAVHELHTGIYNQYTRWTTAYEPFGLRTPGTPNAELALRSHRIFLEIVYFNILVLILTSAASYLLARRTLRPIEAAHEQQKRFTADVSHELRTPLTALKMETEVALLDSKSSGKELRSTLRSNMEEVERMEALINNLLLLSSMEAGKLRNEFTTLDIQEVINNATETVRPLAATKNIKIDAKLEQKQLKGNRGSLTQLFIILLENAVKYSPAGSNVKLTMLRGRGRVIVDIQDSGAGIPASALPHVFDRFYRADTARTSNESTPSPRGFGLGLSLAKLIADLHDGEIVISSTEGSGTSVSVILPTTLKS